jgi:MYXO-CTERM domain-containing protein
MGLVGPASAQPEVIVLQLTESIGGPEQKGGGAGQEQPDVVAITSEGRQYVVTVYMSSNLKDPSDGPWQCKCSSLLLDEGSGPVLYRDQVQLTSNGGDRPCNHPRIASSGVDHAVWGYASNDENGTPRTYVQGINAQCELTTERLRISENDNQNESALDLRHVSGGWFTAGYLSANNNDQDASYAAGIAVSLQDDLLTIERKWLTKVVSPSNVGRPAIAAAGPDRAFFCAAQGNQRPPEDGVACALLDATTGQVLHQELIAKSDPSAKIYYNQPTIAALDDGVLAVQVLESNGVGQKPNIKGQNLSHLHAYQVTGDTFTLQASADKLGVYPTHSAICSGAYGDKGETYVGVMGASPTGLGQPSMQMVRYADGAFTADKQADALLIGYYGDSGRLANLYGNNPGSSGRDFLRCIGDVKNPGFGQKKGFMPDVETFLVAPHAGRVPGEPKNALFIGFIPGKLGTPPDSGPTSGPGTGGGGNGGSGGRDDSVSGCACKVAMPDDTAPPAMAFVALGIGALLARRRGMAA